MKNLRLFSTAPDTTNKAEKLEAKLAMYKTLVDTEKQRSVVTGRLCMYPTPHWAKRKYITFPKI